MNHNFSYRQDKWIDVRQYFNLNNNTTSLYIDDVLVHTWPFNYQPTSTSGTKKLSVLDFYPLTNDYFFFIDNIEFNKVSSLSNNTIEGRSTTAPPKGSAQIAVTDAMQIAVHPNPNNGQFTLEVVAGTPTPLEVKIMDAFGRIVATYKAYDTKSFKQKFDLSQQNKGVYFIRVTSDKEVLTKQVVLAK